MDRDGENDKGRDGKRERDRERKGEEEEEEKTQEQLEEEELMKKMMGFTQFDSTKVGFFMPLSQLLVQGIKAIAQGKCILYVLCSFYM